MCKPYKTGGSPANDIKTIAEMEAEKTIDKVRYPSKRKPMPRKSWTVQKHYNSGFLQHRTTYRHYRSERDARNAYFDFVDKMKNPHNLTGYVDKMELLDTNGKVKETYEIDRTV